MLIVYEEKSNLTCVPFLFILQLINCCLQRLFRKESGSKGAKIGVVFHCQDTEDDVNFDENDMFERDESTEDDEEEPASDNFFPDATDHHLIKPNLKKMTGGN